MIQATRGTPQVQQVVSQLVVVGVSQSVVAVVLDLELKMLLSFVVAVLLAVVPALGQQTCTAECNCDRSNIRLLDDTIEAKVNQSFAEEPSE